MLTDFQKDLMKAIEEGSLDTLKSLIEELTESGSHPGGLHFRDEDGNTPLHVATQVGGVLLSPETGIREPLIVKALLEASPELLNLQVGIGSAEDSKWTALHIAAMYRNTDILNYLMAQKARPDLPDGHGYLFTEYFPRQELEQIRAVYETNYGMPMQVPNNRIQDLWEHHFRVVFLPEFEREPVAAVSGNSSTQGRVPEVLIVSIVSPQANVLNAQRNVIDINDVRNLPLSQRRDAMNRNRELNHRFIDREFSDRYSNIYYASREILNANPSSRNHNPAMTR